MKNNYYISSFVWSFIAKLVDAGFRFFSIPWLLRYFGKEDFGILTLALATNAYMQILDMGISTGAVKHFAQWMSEEKNELIDKVSRTCISFYGIIGTINAIVLLLVAFLGEKWFQLSAAQFKVFQSFLILSALFSVVNWITSVFSQLLIANEKMVFVQHVSLFKTIFNILIILATVYLKLSLINYFLLFLIVNSIIVIPYYLKTKRQGLISSFIPQAYWGGFKVIFKYSLAIFAMGLFQMTATKSRPIVLGIFSNKGVGLLTEYRIVEVFPLFIISIGGVLISIFLPRSAKMITRNKLTEIRKFAYDSTLYSSILVTMLCFPVIISAREILTLYVGAEYSYLHGWLSLWCFTLVLCLHNSPVASLVLATGKTKMLVFSSAVSCIISICINAFLAKQYGVGSAVIGYLVYIIIQMVFYYLYFNSKVLHLKSWNVFRSFAVPAGMGLFLLLVVRLINIQVPNMMMQAMLNVMLWMILYVALLIFMGVVDYNKLYAILNSK